jgi:hypothetical protein
MGRTLFEQMPRYSQLTAAVLRGAGNRHYGTIVTASAPSPLRRYRELPSDFAKRRWMWMVIRRRQSLALSRDDFAAATLASEDP